MSSHTFDLNISQEEETTYAGGEDHNPDKLHDTSYKNAAALDLNTALDLNSDLNFMDMNIFEDFVDDEQGEENDPHDLSQILEEDSPLLDLNCAPDFFDMDFLANSEDFTDHYIFDLNKSPLDLNEPPLDEHDEFSFDDSQFFENPPNLGENVPQNMIKRKLKVLSNDHRHAIYLALLKRSVNGRLKQGTTKDVATEFSVNIRTVQRIWKRAKETSSRGHVDVSHLKTKNCGRKRVQFDCERFRSIPLSQRTTLKSTAYAMRLSTTTLFRHFKDYGTVRRHSNSIKPLLTDKNMKNRVEFCLSMLEEDSLGNNPRFVSMEDIIHIDEKWFHLTKKSENYYLLVDEEEPQRTCKSKNFVLKVMFLAAVARPRFDGQGNVSFSGKIGIYPFVTKEPAKRSSSNRVAGTLETKVMTSVGRDIIRSSLIEKVLPDIRAKWSDGNSKIIWIQQDNARTHVDPNDLEFRQAASKYGFDIRLMCQPANSPDLNILDLGYFNAIQSLRYKECPKTIDDLISAVERSFEAFLPTSSNRIFCTLQQCMVEILKVRGSNKYNS